MANPGGERQPFGYGGGADASASRPTWASGKVDGDALTDAVPAVGPIARPARSRLGRNLAIGGAGALVLTSAFIAGQLRGPDQAAASGPGPGNTPTPGMTETPTATPGSQDHELQPGQCIELQASGDQVIIVQGDTTINGANIFDNKADTAAEAKLVNGDYNICAPFGADVQQTNKAQADTILGSDTEQALDTGKFTAVVVFKFDQGHMVRGSSN